MATSEIRSALFVPATRPDRIPKALAGGADAVIVDLEDAVHDSLKAEARANLDNFLDAHPGARVHVRINAPGNPEQQADLELCRRPEVAGVLLPKAEDAGQVARAAAAGKPVWPIIESANALLALANIAHAGGVARLAFGSLDLALDLGLASGTAAAERMLDQARYSLLLHSRAAGLAPPLDGVFPAIADTDGLTRAAGAARDMGFGGMLCIHPSQVAVVHAAFVPDDAELAWARRVAAASAGGDGVFVVDGRMVDAPVLAHARRLLAQAGEEG